MGVHDRWWKTQKQPDGSRKRVHSAEYGVGDRWQVRWRDEEGTQRKRNFPKKAGNDADTCAEAFDAKVKRDLDQGTSVDVEAGKLTVKESAKKWRVDLIHRDSTAERMARAFRLHVDPILGHLRMSQVRPSHIRRWVKDRSEVLAPSTLAVVYSYLVSFFATAVIDRSIGVSPCAGVKLPEVEKHPHFIPSPGQVHTLAEVLHPRYSAMVYLAAGCGMRGGEIMGLEVDSIDFLRREIDVSQQLVCVTGRKPYLRRPKTKTSVRTVELPEVAANALALHLERYPPIDVEIDDETDPRRPVRRKARLVFLWAGAKGAGKCDPSPIHRASWSPTFTPAARKAGLPKRAGLHCLRHYFATLLIHQGASVKTVQMALGHSTPTVTLNTYVGEWPEAQDRTRALVDSALGRVPSMCPAAAVGS